MNTSVISPPELKRLRPSLTAALPLRGGLWRQFAAAVIVALGAVFTLSLFGNLLLARANIGNLTLETRMTNQAVGQVITEAQQDYKLAIIHPDNSVRKFPLSEVGVKVDTPSTIDVLRQQQRQVGNLLAWWRPLNTQFVITAQPGAVETFVAEHATIVTQPASNAGLKITDGVVEIVPSVTGQQYGLPDGAETVMNHVANLDTQALELAKLPLAANITETDLVDAKTKLEGTLSQSIAITIGTEVVKPSPADIGSWLVLTEDESAKTVVTTVNQPAVQAYLANLAKTYTHTRTNQVVSAIDGSILKTGKNGVTVTSTQEASDAMIANLLTADGIAVTLPANITAYRTVTAPTSSKWIEINTTTKRMYVYDQGEPIRTFLITAGAPQTPTITGNFSIYYKNRLQNMSGTNADGSTYFQPDVPYAMFFRGNYGIHGAYWQPDANFGVVNASHGCVRMRVWEAAWLFDWAPVGTPVVVHR